MPTSDWDEVGGKLALATAMLNALSDKVSTKGGKRGADNFRTTCDDMLRDEWERDGTDRKVLRIKGKKVGTITARTSKPIDEMVPVIRDADAFVAWLRTSDGGLDALRRALSTKPADMLAWATADGELPDGCSIEKRELPERFLGTTVRVDKRLVMRALQDELPGEAMRMLGDGE